MPIISVTIPDATLVAALQQDGYTVTPPAVPPPPPPPVPPPPSLNTVTRVLYCMNGPHEGVIDAAGDLLADVPAYWDWGTHPSVGNAVPPSWCTAVTAWGQVYSLDAFKNAEPPQGSVRVELKNMEAYVWSRSRSAWVRVQNSLDPAGAHFVDNFAGNASTPTDWRTEPDGGISSSLVNGFNVHFWPAAGRGSINPSDIGAFFSTLQARLIGPSASLAHYVANVGGDWWRDMTVGYGDGSNNPGIGQGRFCALSPSWQAYNFYTGGPYATSAAGAWSEAQLSASPPPMDAMGRP